MISYLVTSKFTRLGNIRSRKTSNRLIERIFSGFRLFLVALTCHAGHSQCWWWNLLSRGKTCVSSQTLWKCEILEKVFFKFHSFYIFLLYSEELYARKFCCSFHVLFWFFLVQSNAGGAWIFSKVWYFSKQTLMESRGLRE